jgi:hypothetical protein
MFHGLYYTFNKTNAAVQWGVCEDDKDTSMTVMETVMLVMAIKVIIMLKTKVMGRMTLTILNGVDVGCMSR